MSGLIWAGIGKGLADAGATFGQYMLRDIEDRRRQEAEDRREAQALKRLEEADRIKTERDVAREEALQQRVIKDTAAARARGQEIGRAREAVAYDKLAESSARAGEEGDIALTKEQLRDLPPELKRQYQSMGLINEKLPLTADQRRLQSAQDDLAGAMEMGAHSSVIKGFQEIRKGVLDEIREENKERERKADRDATNRRLDLYEERIESRNRTDQQKADAATTQAGASVTRANRPAASGGGSSDKPATTADLQRQINAANNTLARQLGVPVKDVNAELAALRRKADRGESSAQEKLKAIESSLKELTDANYRMMQFKRNTPGESGSAPAPSNNAGASSAARPALSSFFRQ